MGHKMVVEVDMDSINLENPDYLQITGLMLQLAVKTIAQRLLSQKQRIEAQAAGTGWTLALGYELDGTLTRVVNYNQDLGELIEEMAAGSFNDMPETIARFIEDVEQRRKLQAETEKINEEDEDES